MQKVKSKYKLSKYIDSTDFLSSKKYMSSNLSKNCKKKLSQFKSRGNIRQDVLLKTLLGVPNLVDIEKIAKAERDDQRKD